MTVAVLYFDNNTGDRRYDVLQKGLADMLVTDLSSVPALEVVEREKLEEVIGELKLQRSRYFDPKTAQKLGRMIGAKYAVTGAFAAIDPKMRIDIRLVEVKTARVMMADKVVGKQDAFFDLQEQLVRKFVRGLDLRAKVAPESGVTDVQTLLAYSEGIDSADKGDLEAASQKLGQVVRSAPNFTLAQKKYTEILRRLRLAKKRREKGLGDDEQVLLANIERELGRELGRLDDKEAHRYFAYRVARSNVHLWRARTMAGLGPSEYGPAWVPKKARREIRTHLQGFFENTETFIAEMQAYQAKTDKRGRRRSVDMDLPEEDRRRGKQLGIADDIGEWTFASPYRVKRTLAEFALLGTTPFWLEQDRFVVRPSLAEMAPVYAKKSFALLAQARKEIEATESGESLVDAMAENIDTHAEGLLRLGRREEAIAQWQSFLDRYPKATQYKDFEAKIEAILGISDKAMAYQQALSSCDNQLMGLVYEEVERVGRAEGTAGVVRMVGEIEKRCVRGTMGPAFAMQGYVHAARYGGMNGDCDLYADMLARSRKLGPAYATAVEQLDTPCKK